MTETVVYVGVAVLLMSLHFAGLGVWVAQQKGRSLREGALLGLLYGPVGVIVLAVLPTGCGATPSPQTMSPGGAASDPPWLDEFGQPAALPHEVVWLNELERRANR